MRTKCFFIAIVSLSAMFLFGCMHRPSTLLKSDEEDIHTASVKLADSAESISNSLQELAAIERASHPAPKVPNPLNPEMIGMAQPISIDWTGPIGPLVQKIAKISDYRVRVLGIAPPIPIIVSLTAKNTLLADILRDANFQCGQRANIAVYASNRVIELRYAKN